MLYNLLADHAKERPKHPAIIAENQTFNWSQLRGQTDSLAAGLSANGIKPGNSVALLLPNGPCFVIGFLALARLGSVAVPLSTELKSDEIISALKTSNCRYLLADKKFVPLCKKLLQDRILLKTFVRDGRDSDSGLPTISSIAAHISGRLALPIPSGNTTMIEQLTSGTTGQPKHIIRTHAHLLAEASAFAATIHTSPSDRILAVVPMSHAHGLGNGLMAALYSGATLILQERFDRRETLRLLTKEKITLFPAVPFMISIIADTLTNEPVDLSSLRLCFTAGSTLRQEILIKARNRFGITLHQLYGSTETGALTINLDKNEDAKINSVGLPLEGVQISIMNEIGSQMSPDTEGEIAVRSPAAAEYTIGSEGKKPLSDSNGWIRMGDIGRLDSGGHLYLIGRKSVIINVASRKVIPAEVESILLKYPKVRETVVIGVRDPYGEEAVKATVVTREPCTSEELFKHCRKYLADYKAPRIIEFRDKIPRCPAGKILRSQLMEKICES